MNKSNGNVIIVVIHGKERILISEIYAHFAVVAEVGTYMSMIGL